MLVVFAGLPGVGKTTISRDVAARLGAVFLRIDDIERVLRARGPVGAAGYAVAQAVAAANLAIGHVVVADCVSPVPESRDAWQRVAADAGCRLLDVEIVCSDVVEHRRRVEARAAALGDLVPSWADVLARDYRPWDRPRLVLDTAQFDADAAADTVAKAVAKTVERATAAPGPDRQNVL